MQSWFNTFDARVCGCMCVWFTQCEFRELIPFLSPNATNTITLAEKLKIPIGSNAYSLITINFTVNYCTKYQNQPTKFQSIRIRLHFCAIKEGLDCFLSRQKKMWFFFCHLNWHTPTPFMKSFRCVIFVQIKSQFWYVCKTISNNCMS